MSTRILKHFFFIDAKTYYFINTAVTDTDVYTMIVYTVVAYTTSSIIVDENTVLCLNKSATSYGDH